MCPSLPRCHFYSLTRSTATQERCVCFMTATIKVDNNGNWPDGWSRTPIGNRRTRVQWRKPQDFYLDALVKELSRMGSMSVLVSYGKNERLDPGVSVYFTRVSDPQDFSWQWTARSFVPARLLV